MKDKNGIHAQAGPGILRAEARGDLLILTIAPWQRIFPRLRAAFSTRLGGVSGAPFTSLNLSHQVGDWPSRVQANHDRLFAAIGIHGPVHVVQQVHGTHITRVPTAPVTAITTTPAGYQLFHLGQADGIATATTGQSLMILYADCVPLLLVAPAAGALAVVHAGWRGTLAGVARAAVTCLADHFDQDPNGIHAALGPAIGPCCYAVDEPVVAAARQALPQPDAALTRGEDGQTRLDLWQANSQMLTLAGVPAGQIVMAGLCTACRPHWFFSHRGEGGRTGRLGLVASWQ